MVGAPNVWKRGACASASTGLNQAGIPCRRSKGATGLGRTSRGRRLGAGRQDFVAPGDGGGFFEHGGHGAVFVFAEPDGVLDCGVIKLAAQAVENFYLDPDGG